MEQIAYTTALSFLVVLPMGALIFAFIPVVFFSKGKSVFRETYQRQLIYLIGSAVISHVSAKFIGTRIEYTQDAKVILDGFSISIPSILYAICIFLAAKRLNNMGYSRFISLSAALPFAGPAMLMWLAVTIRQKQI